ncbi:MAG: hypothetical protein ABSF29_13185 [Tepidisphaeraceae bacterium]|jgi:hypothetical protein
MNTWLLADEISPESYATNLKGLIFLGVFVLLAMVAFIWWLRR